MTLSKYDWLYNSSHICRVVLAKAHTAEYRVAKTHRMPEVAGHFSQKSHWL